MNNKKSTKRALLSSVLSLVICMTMLIGTTFAWFTDSVTSAGNIIKSGNLKVTMEWLEGKTNPTTASDADWKDASQGPIFKSTLWEPGYTEVRHIKIANEGTLALKYDVKIQANGEVSKLAEVIDVYYIDPATEAITDRTQLKDENKLGTLDDVLDNLANTATGNLEAGENDTITLALKMQESAGNEYQNLAIGSDFSVILFATQLASESDSFDNQYDVNAPKMFTVNGVAYDDAASALAAAKENDKIYLSSVTEPIVINEKVELTIANTNIVAGEGVNAITVNADATIVAEGYNAVIGGKKADGIYVADGVALTLTGKGNLIAKGNGGSETQEEYNKGFGGSGIDVNGTIVINNLSSLTAEGYGKHAFGIGGNTKSIEIKNSTVNYAKGGMVKAAITDNNYGKNEAEAGAAIGSKQHGAIINITGSTIKKAEGGSKGAGIGAMYHIGVTVNITDSTVTAFGGTASAGIGGSRITKHDSAESQAINVTIINSTVNATGGDFAAGIGSGYNTYTADARPLTTVTIDAKSNITAQGGLLGAGVGTGHNSIDFVGDIACDTTYIKAGSSEDPSWCCWGAPCTVAEDVGLGVYSIGKFYKDPSIVHSTSELLSAIANAPASEEKAIFLAEGRYEGNIDITLAAIGTQKGDLVFKALDEDVVIAGTVTLGYRNQGTGSAMWNSNVTFEGITFDHAQSATHSLDVQDVKSLTLKNCTIIGDGEYGISSARGNATGKSTITSCNFENAGMQILGNFGSGLVIEKCVFNESRINVQAGNSVTVTGCTFNNTLTDANLGDSFYLVRSNSTSITVTGCTMNIDSTLSSVATNQEKWGVFWNRGTTNWTVKDVTVNLAASAKTQTELKITKTTSTGVINTENLTVK